MTNQPPIPDYSKKDNRVALLAQIAHECITTGIWEEVITRNGIAKVYRQNPAVAIQALKQIAAELGPEPEDDGFDVDVEYSVLTDEEAAEIANQVLISADDDETY